MFGVEFRRYLSISSPYIQFLESLGNELGAEECSVFVDEDVPMIPLIHLGNLGFKILPQQIHNIFLALYLKFIGRLVSRQFRIWYLILSTNGLFAKFYKSVLSELIPCTIDPSITHPWKPFIRAFASDRGNISPADHPDSGANRLQKEYITIIILLLHNNRHVIKICRQKCSLDGCGEIILSIKQ